MKSDSVASLILREDLEKHWPGYVHAEFVFYASRMFRFDFAVPIMKFGFEINGGLFIKGKSGFGGAHSLPTNILRDMEKKNLANLDGWRIFEFTPQQVEKGLHIWILDELKKQEEK